MPVHDELDFECPAEIADKAAKELQDCMYNAGEFLCGEPHFPADAEIGDHYQNGFDKAIAGMDNGIITGVESGSGRGYGDMSLKENERLYTKGYNIISAHTDGLLYSDSQLANYLLTERSALQEFHNNSIINRILKKLYLSLQFEKHRLNSAEAVAKITFKIDNDIRSEFQNKVRALAYSGYFESAFTEAIGLMQHRLEIQFFNTIKYHHIYIQALPSAS